jgi:hypothetical protein
VQTFQNEIPKLKKKRKIEKRAKKKKSVKILNKDIEWLIVVMIMRQISPHRFSQNGDKFSVWYDEFVARIHEFVMGWNVVKEGNILN